MVRQTFGGRWTEEKLARVERYLRSYAIALKNQPFRRIYIDAFAGTGYREEKPRGESLELNLPGMQKLAQGSARIALKIEPAFDRYIFIEKSRGKVEELRKLGIEFPAQRIEYIVDDANSAIQRICTSIAWRSNRAVLFLDPCGMQVEWKTIEAIAGTRAIDLWYLFPAGIGVGRMLPHSGEVPEEWKQVLDRTLGTPDWRSAFYVERTEHGLFGADARFEREFDIQKMEAWFKMRLNAIFSGVGNRAVPLGTQRGSPMYLLFFACGNPRGASTALKIANHILK